MNNGHRSGVCHLCHQSCQRSLRPLKSRQYNQARYGFGFHGYGSRSRPTDSGSVATVLSPSLRFPVQLPFSRIFFSTESVGVGEPEHRDDGAFHSGAYEPTLEAPVDSPQPNVDHAGEPESAASSLPTSSARARRRQRLNRPASKPARLQPLRDPLPESAPLTPFTTAAREKLAQVEQFKHDNLAPTSPLARLRRDHIRRAEAAEPQVRIPSTDTKAQDRFAKQSIDCVAANPRIVDEPPTEDAMATEEFAGNVAVPLHRLSRAANTAWLKSCSGNVGTADKGLQVPGHAVEKARLLSMATLMIPEFPTRRRSELAQKPRLAEDVVADSYFILERKDQLDQPEATHVLREEIFRMDQRRASAANQNRSPLVDVSDRVIVIPRSKSSARHNCEDAEQEVKVFHRVIRGGLPAQTKVQLLMKPTEFPELSASRRDLEAVFDCCREIAELPRIIKFAIENFQGPFFLGWWIADVVGIALKRAAVPRDGSSTRAIFGVLHLLRASQIQLSRRLLQTAWRLALHDSSFGAMHTLIQYAKDAGYDSGSIFGTSSPALDMYQFIERPCPDDQWQMAVRPGSIREPDGLHLGPPAWMKHDRMELLTGLSFNSMPKSEEHELSRFYSQIQRSEYWSSSNYSRATLHDFEAKIKNLTHLDPVERHHAMNDIFYPYFIRLLETGDWSLASEVLKMYPECIEYGVDKVADTLVDLCTKLDDDRSRRSIIVAQHRRNPMTGTTYSGKWHHLLNDLMRSYLRFPGGIRSARVESAHPYPTAPTGLAEILAVWTSGIREVLDTTDAEWTTRIVSLFEKESADPEDASGTQILSNEHESPTGRQHPTQSGERPFLGAGGSLGSKLEELEIAVSTQEYHAVPLICASQLWPFFETIVGQGESWTAGSTPFWRSYRKYLEAERHEPIIRGTEIPGWLTFEVELLDISRLLALRDGNNNFYEQHPGAIQLDVPKMSPSFSKLGDHLFSGLGNHLSEQAETEGLGRVTVQQKLISLGLWVDTSRSRRCPAKHRTYLYGRDIWYSFEPYNTPWRLPPQPAGSPGQSDISWNSVKNANPSSFTMHAEYIARVHSLLMEHQDISMVLHRAGIIPTGQPLAKTTVTIDGNSPLRQPKLHPRLRAAFESLLCRGMQSGDQQIIRAVLRDRPFKALRSLKRAASVQLAREQLQLTTVSTDQEFDVVSLAEDCMMDHANFRRTRLKLAGISQAMREKLTTLVEAEEALQEPTSARFKTTLSGFRRRMTSSLLQAWSISQTWRMQFTELLLRVVDCLESGKENDKVMRRVLDEMSDPKMKLDNDSTAGSLSSPSPLGVIAKPMNSATGIATAESTQFEAAVAKLTDEEPQLISRLKQALTSAGKGLQGEEGQHDGSLALQFQAAACKTHQNAPIDTDASLARRRRRRRSSERNSAYKLGREERRRLKRRASQPMISLAPPLRRLQTMPDRSHPSSATITAATACIRLWPPRRGERSRYLARGTSYGGSSSTISTTSATSSEPKTTAPATDRPRPLLRFKVGTPWYIKRERQRPLLPRHFV